MIFCLLNVYTFFRSMQVSLLIIAIIAILALSGCSSRKSQSCLPLVDNKGTAMFIHNGSSWTTYLSCTGYEYKFLSGYEYSYCPNMANRKSLLAVISAKCGSTSTTTTTTAATTTTTVAPLEAVLAPILAEESVDDTASDETSEWETLGEDGTEETTYTDEDTSQLLNTTM